eukprot:TRINITY_DN7792_c0_g1_i1.p1 TRINITY_DN7792_c0_g1~~TRINITY_DN7792_c0_g1_i1.p1  ORF type:complete len:93 (-),score=9.92 TRINITY_DN7792_c0_g1_i1:120-398(-)
MMKRKSSKYLPPVSFELPSKSKRQNIKIAKRLKKRKQTPFPGKALPAAIVQKSSSKKLTPKKSSRKKAPPRATAGKFWVVGGIHKASVSRLG